jgi:hypothetical protein
MEIKSDKSKVQSSQTQKVILKGCSNVSLLNKTFISYTDPHPLKKYGVTSLEGIQLFMTQKDKALEPMILNDDSNLLEIKPIKIDWQKQLNEYDQRYLSSSFNSSHFN